MPSPVLPSQFKAIIVDPNATLCGNFISALLKLPTLIYTWFAWAFDASGNATKAFINQSLRTGDIIQSACLQNEDGNRLLCDGRQVSQTTYPDLYAALGSTYGAASGGLFFLPDLRAKFPCGIGSFTNAGTVALGVATGADQVTLVAANHAAHTHSLHVLKVQHGSIDTEVFTPATGDSAQQSDRDSLSQGTATPFNIIPPTLGLYYYVIC
jgi:microcystin-dependent protein